MSAHHQLEGHTYQRFDGELNHLHLSLLEMGGLVTDQASEALDSIKHQDLIKARKVCEREHQVDVLEKEIDSRITAILAKRSPLARDLRGLMAFSKAVTDLERIGNEAVRMASISKIIYENEVSNPSSYLLHDVHAMGKVVCNQLKESLNIFDLLDFERAEVLLNNRDELDEEFEVGLRRLTTYVMEDSRNVGHVINIVLVLKSLERIGNHAHNLAEYIVYLVSGEDVRHSESNA